ncbi:PPE domain-containing protein [Nocardia veterana]|uniref:PPE domain-containing protein n=1 Tax=Nocardia veterana TaxID=132249 RepID=A0A7X6M3Z5_9NOCA|nr:PPE domain-containing protein [Nocardia veterana]NKY88782.1 PPE domain-containing protein [Nocardia veterana]
MIEPPQPGFTGVVWPAREPDRLARDLTTGPGAVPMAEAGAAWSRLAAEFGAAVVEYDQIVAGLRGAWESANSGPVLDKVATLRDWLADAAAAAAANAQRAGIQAAAYEVARLAMPDAGELAALQTIQQALRQLGVSLGAPVRAVAAGADEDTDMAKAAAARVMQTYEGATAPLAEPWEQQQPPVIASAAAFESEQAAAAPPGRAAVNVPDIAAAPLPAGAAVPRVLTAYRPTAFVAATQTTETAVPQLVPAQQATAASPLPYAPVAAAANAAEEQEHEPRAGYAGADIGADLGIVAAPAVLGEAAGQGSGRAVAKGGAA